MQKILLFGGYGTFGSHIARDLARLGFSLTIAGRHFERACTFAQKLGPEHHVIQVDVTDPKTYRSALETHAVAVNCAGPFSVLGKSLLEACVSVRCHYVDIADDREYARLVRSYHSAFERNKIFAVSGCSSLPAISGALGLKLMDFAKTRGRGTPEKIHSTLFIGNDNPKGSAAVTSALELLGKPISTSNGIIYGFREGRKVSLPLPFGSRHVYAFESPEYDLFTDLFGIEEIRVFVGFELRLATQVFHALSYFPETFRAISRKMLRYAGRWKLPLGCSGGAIQTELIWPDSRVSSAVLFSPNEGQRMAAFPCVYAVQSLVNQTLSCGPGARTAYDLQGAQPLLEALIHEGFSLNTEESGAYAPASA